MAIGEKFQDILSMLSQNVGLHRPPSLLLSGLLSFLARTQDNGMEVKNQIDQIDIIYLFCLLKE